MRSRTETRSPGGTIDGVPPPTNTEVAVGIPAATSRSRSARQAVRYASVRWCRSVQVANEQ
jgi:hypothetical protein